MTALIRLAINSLNAESMPVVKRKHSLNEWFMFIVKSQVAIDAHDREQAKREVGI